MAPPVRYRPPMVPHSKADSDQGGDRETEPAQPNAKRMTLRACPWPSPRAVSYTHLRAHETSAHL
eukprot:6737020-Alexandrium_andersonii.AAC.1